MHTAVDYNVSSSSTNRNNITNITTTTTTTNNVAIMKNNGGGDNIISATMTLTAPTATATPAITAASSMVVASIATAKTTTAATTSPFLPEQQQRSVVQQNVLRNRLHMGTSTQQTLPQQQQQQQHSHKNSLLIASNNGHTHLNFNVAEYLGSNVEQMSVTPSPSPQVSPAKKSTNSQPTPKVITKVELKKIQPATSLQPPPPPSSSSSSPPSSASSSNSTGNSNSNSTTSSVIATPILTRNGNATIMHDNGECDGGGGGHEIADDINYIETITSLPIKSASFSTLCDHHLTKPPTSATVPIKTAAFISSNSSISSSSSGGATPSMLTPTATMTTTTAITSKSSSTLDEDDLLHWNDMPQYLQFNPYVLKGYRPLQTFKGCLFSLFYWHNETINILTHAIPIIYILAIVPGLMPWDRGYRFLSFCHVFGSVAPWCGSFVYHLFMNIEKGENVYYRLLKLDMVGIWVSQSFGALPLVTATTFCFSYKWKCFIIATYCLMSLWGLYKALTASSPWQRRLCFALPFTMRSILTFLRTLGVVGGNQVALSHVYLQDGVSIVGGAIGAMRIPEKWFPGLVDFYLNSHNIMHVLVVVAVYSMHKATIKDFEWMSAATCETFTTVTNDTLETTLSANIEL